MPSAFLSPDYNLKTIFQKDAAVKFHSYLPSQNLPINQNLQLLPNILSVTLGNHEESHFSSSGFLIWNWTVLGDKSQETEGNYKVCATVCQYQNCFCPSHFWREAGIVPLCYNYWTASPRGCELIMIDCKGETVMKKERKTRRRKGAKFQIQLISKKFGRK